MIYPRIFQHKKKFQAPWLAQVVRNYILALSFCQSQKKGHKIEQIRGC